MNTTRKHAPLNDGQITAILRSSEQPPDNHHEIVVRKVTAADGAVIAWITIQLEGAQCVPSSCPSKHITTTTQGSDHDG